MQSCKPALGTRLAGRNSVCTSTCRSPDVSSWNPAAY